MKKAFIIAPILIVIILFVVFFIRKEKKAEGKYVTAQVQRGDVAITVTATGSLEAVTTILVGSQVSGTISALNVDFNDLVKKGQIIAQLDPTFLNAQMVQGEADLEKTTASAALAKSNYDRSISMFERNMISASDRDIALATFQQSEADLKSSKANLDRLKTNLNYTTIRSPINGVVISRDVDVGQTVAASLSAPTLYTIAQDLTKMQVKTSIDEADIGKIQQGQNAIFTVDAYPDKNFEGTVQQIRLNPTVVQNVVSYDVILAVPNPELLLKPGMTANVTVVIDRQDDVLKVPAAALRFHPAGTGQGVSTRKQGTASTSGGITPTAGASPVTPDSSFTKRSHQPRLWVLDKQGKPEPVAVQVGISDGTTIQITTDNLKEGDSVIVSQEGVVQSTNNNQQVNPFLPRFGGGRGGR
jgi:HlyD family secretion protein